MREALTASGPEPGFGRSCRLSRVGVDADELDGLRGSLLGFCYQLLGSPFEAEDAVQDAMERAWKARDSFDPAAGSLSTWVFRIARNVCFDALRGARRRPLPRDLREPGIEIGAPLVPAFDVPWLMPAPTAWLRESAPETAIVKAEDIRLAVTAMLQALPPQQRGVFVLREVLAFSAAETADILEITVAAVNSSLQRARTAVREGTVRRAELRPSIVEHYARAIEAADADALARLVAEDVVFEMPPVPQWSLGRATYAAFMAALFEWRGTRWETRPIAANGQPGILLFLVTDDGPVPHTVQLFDASPTGEAIGHILVYQDPRLFELFERESAAER